jgi:predicted DNA-binding transcriptional regulator YafY
MPPVPDPSPEASAPDAPQRVPLPGPRDNEAQLLAWLHEGRELTKADIAERLSCDERTAKRYVNRLCADGVPVAEGKRGRRKTFYLPEGARRIGDGAPLRLTEDEAQALCVAALSAEALLRPTPLAAPLRAVHGRLARQLDPHVYTFEPESEEQRWHVGATSAPIDAEVFGALVRAVRAQRPVAIDYVTASRGGCRSTGRRIHPLTLGLKGGSWMCAAFCTRRQALRDFALAGIERAEVIEDETFARPADYDAKGHFAPRFSATTGPLTCVRLLFDADVAAYARRKVYHPSQTTTERDDGRLEVEMEVAGLKDVRSWVRSWGPQVVVLAPEALARQVAADARAMARRYAALGFDDDARGDGARRGSASA